MIVEEDAINQFKGTSALVSAQPGEGALMLIQAWAARMAEAGCNVTYVNDHDYGRWVLPSKTPSTRVITRSKYDSNADLKGDDWSLTIIHADDWEDWKMLSSMVCSNSFMLIVLEDLLNPIPDAIRREFTYTITVRADRGSRKFGPPHALRVGITNREG